jgi:hypothetical protein
VFRACWVGLAGDARCRHVRRVGHLSFSFPLQGVSCLTFRLFLLAACVPPCSFSLTVPSSGDSRLVLPLVETVRHADVAVV